MRKDRCLAAVVQADDADLALLLAKPERLPHVCKGAVIKKRVEFYRWFSEYDPNHNSPPRRRALTEVVVMCAVSFFLIFFPDY